MYLTNSNFYRFFLSDNSVFQHFTRGIVYLKTKVATAAVSEPLCGWNEAVLLFRLISHTNRNLRMSHDYKTTFSKAMPSFIC